MTRQMKAIITHIMPLVTHSINIMEHVCNIHKKTFWCTTMTINKHDKSGIKADRGSMDRNQYSLLALVPE